VQNYNILSIYQNNVLKNILVFL
jgi:hypothetical protein